MKKIYIRIKNELLMKYLYKFDELTKLHLMDETPAKYYSRIVCEFDDASKDSITIKYSAFVEGSFIYHILTGRFSSDQSFDSIPLLKGNVVDIDDFQEEDFLGVFYHCFHDSKDNEDIQRCLKDIEEGSKNIFRTRDIKVGSKTFKFFGIKVNDTGTITEFMYEEDSNNE